MNNKKLFDLENECQGPTERNVLDGVVHLNLRIRVTGSAGSSTKVNENHRHSRQYVECNNQPVGVPVDGVVAVLARGRVTVGGEVNRHVQTVHPDVTWRQWRTYEKHRPWQALSWRP